MFGASLLEVWGEDFNLHPKRKKKKKTVPITQEAAESGLLIRNQNKPVLTEISRKLSDLRDDRLEGDTYERINPNVVTKGNPYGRKYKEIEEDPDYHSFLEFKNRKQMKQIDRIERIEQPHYVKSKRSENEQFNELILYIFTGFFLLILYDNIYRLGKKSY
jgi:hypothetical protein